MSQVSFSLVFQLPSFRLALVKWVRAEPFTALHFISPSFTHHPKADPGMDWLSLGPYPPLCPAGGHTVMQNFYQEHLIQVEIGDISKREGNTIPEVGKAVG